MKDESRSIKMEGLQDLLIDTFIDRIQSGDDTPALLNAARQLLKDNNISAAVTKGSPMDNLVNILPFDDPTDQVVNE
tara:strand:- start:432 stop:662 length:231 start_codon:yes stop_codon:yes gene_type:complete